MLVSRELTKLQQEFPTLRVEKVDILTHPGRTLRQGVRMIPALHIEDNRLSGIFLGPEAIRQFVLQALQTPNEGPDER